MGWNFRKSIKVGPARINLSKSGVGYSVGAGGLRYTSRANGKKKHRSTSDSKKKVLWKFIVGIFFIIGGLASLPDSLSSFAIGLIIGIVFLLWGAVQGKNAVN